MVKTQPFYLVASQDSSGRLRARRVTQRWPYLESGEVVLRLILEIPDEVIEHPVHTITLEDVDVAVAVEALSPVE